MSTISERLAEFILDTKFESLPDDLIARMQAYTLDLIGVTLVGTGETSSQIIHGLLLSRLNLWPAKDVKPGMPP